MKEADYITAEIWNLLSGCERLRLIGYLKFIGVNVGFTVNEGTIYIHEVIMLDYTGAWVYDSSHIHKDDCKLTSDRIQQMIELSPV